MVRAALILLLWLVATVASATQDGWPALYDVVGVASDDVLNVRARPEPSSPIVGTVAPDTSGVEVIRESKPDEGRAGWGQVNVGEISGWVSLRFMRRQPNQYWGAEVASARCFGTEPFWSLTFDADGSARWATPEGSQKGTVAGRFGNSFRRGTQAIEFTWPAGRDLAVLTWGACDDGMSDARYGIRINLFTRLRSDPMHETDSFLYGCCSLQR